MVTKDLVWKRCREGQLGDPGNGELSKQEKNKQVWPLSLWEKEGKEVM